MALVFILITGAVVMFLWNNILSPVLGIRTLTYPQGIGLLILCRILFGSFRRGGASGPAMRRGSQWRDKWMKMSTEEREKFKEEWRKRCGPNNKNQSGT